MSDVSLCLISKTASGDIADRVFIEKWGAAFENVPEAKLELENSNVVNFSVNTTAAGDLVQKTAFNFRKIRWTHWGGPDPTQPEEYTTGWGIVENQPF